MSPKAFAAALSDFAAAIALSPDPDKSVADLAELMAVRADRDQVLLDALAKAMGKLCWAAPPAFQDSFVTPALAFIKGDSDTMPDLDVDLMFGEERHAGPLDTDEEAFPPLGDHIGTNDGEELAFLASNLSREDWAALPDCDRAHHIAVHQQLAAKAVGEPINFDA